MHPDIHFRGPVSWSVWCIIRGIHAAKHNPFEALVGKSGVGKTKAKRETGFEVLHVIPTVAHKNPLLVLQFAGIGFGLVFIIE